MALKSVYYFIKKSNDYMLTKFHVCRVDFKSFSLRLICLNKSKDPCDNIYIMHAKETIFGSIKILFSTLIIATQNPTN